MSALVIDLCARRHAARVAAEIVATVATRAAQDSAQNAAARLLPAYCDPENDRRGSKYAATKDASVTEVAAFIRADIKAAQKRGDLPACKISTRKRPGAIDVEVQSLPDGFRVTSPAFARYAAQHPDDYRPPFSNADQLSDEWRDLAARLEAICWAYNRDNSDAMVDYFDRRFYGCVGLDSDLRRDRKAGEIAVAGEAPPKA